MYFSKNFNKLGEDSKTVAPKLLNEYGNFLKMDQTDGAKKYLLYPPNNSSPPSPDKATETWDFASLETKRVGICDESANGSL